MSSSGHLFKQGNPGSLPAITGSHIGYWKVDENTGSTVVDQSGGSRTATIQGNPTWVDGRCGYGGDYALDLDGTGDYLSLADDDAFSFGNGATDSAFSIYGIFKLQALSTSTAFFSKYDVANTLREYGIFFDSDGRIRFRIYDESTDGYLERRTDEQLDLNKWYFIACTYTGIAVATNLKIYLNAIQVDTVTSSSGAYTAMENSTTAPLIGAYTNTGSSIDCINGIIDFVAVENVALSAANILTMYNSLRPKSGNFMMENVWQCISDEIIEKAITTYNYPTPLLGDSDGGYKIEVWAIDGSTTSAYGTLLINMVDSVGNASYFYQHAASSVVGGYAAAHTTTPLYIGGSASAYNFCTTSIEIPFSKTGVERFMRQSLSLVTVTGNIVNHWDYSQRMTTPVTSTEITSLGFKANQIGGWGVGSRFRLYKLRGFS